MPNATVAPVTTELERVLQLRQEEHAVCGSTPWMLARTEGHVCWYGHGVLAAFTQIGSWNAIDLPRGTPGSGGFLMQVQKTTIESLFTHERRYLVPLFQRPYVWTQEHQWEPLWDDVRDLAERELETIRRAASRSRSMRSVPARIDDPLTRSRRVDRESSILIVPRMSPRSLGLTLAKTSPKDWPVVSWAVVEGGNTLVASGEIVAPRSYDEADALMFVAERVGRVVDDNAVVRTAIWCIEGNARVNAAMKPRIRSEGALLAAARGAGSSVRLVAWPAIEAAVGAERTKDEYKAAADVCGIPCGNASPHALLAAVAASRAGVT